MHNLLILVSVAGWAIVLIALVLCFRAPQPSHKWLWALLVVFGTVQLSLAVDRGSYRVVSASAAVLRPAVFAGDGAGKDGAGLLLPVGALVFLARRRWAGPRRDG